VEWKGDTENGGRASDGIYYIVFRTGITNEVQQVILKK
jgi:hypothetical protein